MAVYHILKDGSTLTDITGHVVRIEDAAPFYELLSNFNTYGREKNEVKK